MSDPEQLAGKDQPAFSLDDEPISKAYREGAAEAVKMYADEARCLLTAIDEKNACVRMETQPKRRRSGLFL